MERVKMETTSIIIGILLGVLVGWVLFRIIARKQIQNAKKLSNKIKEEAKAEAKVIKKEAELTAKEEWYKKQAELEKEIEKRKNELYELEKRYRDRLSSTEERLSKLDRREQSVIDKERFLERKQNALNEKAKQLDLLLEQENAQLVKVSGMTRDEAIQKLLQRFEQEARVEAAKIRKSIIDDAKSEAKQEAIKILATAIQRTAVDYTIETCVSTVSLPSEEMKGRIIGREGRNIRTFENLTGIELIVDDTPETVVLSGFDPIRREIAKLALERLVADGRIHPGRIEELVKKAEEEINQVIKEAGREACVALGIHDLPENIQDLLGRLKFRTSFGQNVLQHSIETARICGMLAAELGLNQTLAKKIGLLHDIGKAVDHEVNGSHPEIGAEIARRNKLSPIIENAIEAHHEDVEAKSPYAVLIQAADAISGSRPGARRETLEAYLKRLEKLESIASSFEGVYKCFAIQAGREIRIIAENNAIDDAQAEMLASNIANKIETELQYPGQIKVTVIREVRKSALAR